MKLLSQYLSENNNYKILRLENYLLGWHDKARVDEHISLARETVKKHNIILQFKDFYNILKKKKYHSRNKFLGGNKLINLLVTPCNLRIFSVRPRENPA